MSLPAAVLARMQEVVDPSYDGYVPKGPTGQPAVQRYAVLWADPGRVTSTAVSNRQTEVRSSFQVTSVGTTAEQARWVSGLVRDALAGWTPAVPGMRPAPVEHLTTGAARRDDDLSPPLFLVVDTYVCLSDRDAP